MSGAEIQTNGVRAKPDPEWVAHVDACDTSKQAPGALDALVHRIPYDDLFADEPDVVPVISAIGLAPGVISAIFGAGFVGKTLIAMSVGLSIASGRPLWGLFSVVRGRWLHLDYEQGRRHTKRRIVRLMRGMGLDREEMRGWFDVAIFPRLNLTLTDAENLFAELFRGYAIVTIDALRGVIPGIKENDAEVRDFLDMLSRAGERARTVVLFLHHAGKPDPNSKRARRDMGRGSSAIFDACACVFVATAEKGEPGILVSHEKDRELGRTIDDFGLRIEDVEIDGDPKGGLRIVHLDQEQRSATTTSSKTCDKFDALKSAILAVVRENTELASLNAICARVSGGAKGTKLEAIRELLDAGELLQPAGEGSAFRVR